MSIISRAVHRIEMLLVKALIKKIDDTTDIQLLKLTGLAGETQDGIERLQNYGMTSVPPADSEALVVYLNGNRDHGVVVVAESGAYRIKNLKDGEVAFYSKHGQLIHLKDDKSIMITGANKVTFKNAEMNLGSDVLAPTAGVVTGECLCAFTGAPHADYSKKIKAKK